MTQDDVSVRQAIRGDGEHIARVHIDTWRETYSGVLDETFFSEAAFRRRRTFWSDYLNDSRSGQLVVADNGGLLVGFANSGESVGQDAEHGFPAVRPLTLFSIYVLADFHGSGVGQRLFDRVIGDKPAQLWVLRDNKKARAFYERNGFAADGAEYSISAGSDLVELRMVR